MQGIGSFLPIVWLLELDLPSGKRVLTILFYKICSQLSLKLDVSPTTLDDIALEGLTSVVRFVDSNELSGAVVARWVPVTIQWNYRH